MGAEITGLDTPTLIDVWETAPYLARWIGPNVRSDAIQAHNRDERSVDLSEDELGLLAAYLLEIEAGSLPTEPTRRSIFLPMIER